MIATTTPFLTSWSGYYGVTGAAAAALVGLVFVVITLVQTRERQRSAMAMSVFTTPTVVHFTSALVISAILEAPWPALWIAAFPLAGVAIFGLGYVCLAAYRSRKLDSYTPDMEDRIWHGLLPLVSYIALLVACFALPRFPVTALFAPATATALLMIVGIHNAWDIVTYVALDRD